MDVDALAGVLPEVLEMLPLAEGHRGVFFARHERWLEVKRSFDPDGPFCSLLLQPP